MESFSPDFVERKGSLFLRSDHMNYSRGTLNSNWHQAREAEPKDYDIKDQTKQKQNLHKTTYKRIGNVTDGSSPKTTTQALMEQVNLKDDFAEQERRKAMVTTDTYNLVDLDRHTGHANTGYGSVLPRHHPEHDKHHLETTSRADYRAPFPYTPALEQPPEFKDHSNAFRKCHSQFTDVDDYRRFGRNTWHDESGQYSNSQLKKSMVTNTIPQTLE